MYSPRSLEINFASIWFAVLTRVRSAPTTTPPDGSLTVPPKLALPICADAETAKIQQAKQKNAQNPKNLDRCSLLPIIPPRSRNCAESFFCKAGKVATPQARRRSTASEHHFAQSFAADISIAAGKVFALSREVKF